MHRSAGAIIKNKEGKILLIDRANFPYGFACPSGHIEEGESPEDAMVREVKEEVHLSVQKYKPILNEFNAANTCKRGIKGHDWHIFEVIEWGGKAKGNEEAKSIGWYSPEEINELVLEDVWRLWFEKLKII
jgi:ADP-ribose pyrophosphatase YjhB (NUDIX family)